MEEAEYNSSRTLVVGAGLTGLMIADRLRPGAVILEKSRGVGGRMATRRSETAKFDHGAQFYSLKKPIEKLHEAWLAHSLVKPWFEAKGVSHFAGVNGMTNLAKNLAQTADIKLNTRVVKVEKTANGWRAYCENQITFDGARLVITSPLPQTLEILRTSEIGFDRKLELISYAKAVVALIEPETSVANLAGSDGYREVEAGPIFSIANQTAKSVSVSPAITVTLNAGVSEELYDKTDEELTNFVLKELKTFDANFVARSVQIKKWRYSHPLSTFAELYSQPAPGLFLAGDAFVGPSLNGAARSAAALLASFT